MATLLLPKIKTKRNIFFVIKEEKDKYIIKSFRNRALVSYIEFITKLLQRPIYIVEFNISIDDLYLTFVFRCFQHLFHLSWLLFGAYLPCLFLFLFLSPSQAIREKHKIEGKRDRLFTIGEGTLVLSY